MTQNVHIMDHPLIQHKISLLRDKNTTVKEFRELVNEIAMLMCYDAFRNLKLKDVEIETPVATAHSKMLAGPDIAVVPILRAGMGMLDGILNLVPNAKVGHIGLYRNPRTLEPVEYYCKVPKDIDKREVFIIDPMLATGGSAIAAIKFLKDKGAQNIKFLCLIAAPEGLEKICAAYPEVEIFCASLDEKLNDHGYIVPGLGDAGDRIYGTK